MNKIIEKMFVKVAIIDSWLKTKMENVNRTRKGIIVRGFEAFKNNRCEYTKFTDKLVRWCDTCEDNLFFRQKSWFCKILLKLVLRFKDRLIFARRHPL